MKTDYVVGFLFRDNRTSVVLVRKNKPAWQAGLFNGVGGKIESTETPAEAMVREFMEETGVTVPLEEWRKFCYMQGSEFALHCFVAFDSDKWEKAKTVEAEEIVKVHPDDLSREECVSNLKWLVEMALDDNDGRPFMATVQYPDR